MNQREGFSKKKKRPSLRNTNQTIGPFLAQKKPVGLIAYPTPRGMIDFTV